MTETARRPVNGTALPGDWTWEDGAWHRWLPYFGDPPDEAFTAWIRLDAEGCFWTRLTLPYGWDTGWRPARLASVHKLAAVWVAVERPGDVGLTWKRITGSDVPT